MEDWETDLREIIEDELGAVNEGIEDLIRSDYPFFVDLTQQPNYSSLGEDYIYKLWKEGIGRKFQQKAILFISQNKQLEASILLQKFSEEFHNLYPESQVREWIEKEVQNQAKPKLQPSVHTPPNPPSEEMKLSSHLTERENLNFQIPLAPTVVSSGPRCLEELNVKLFLMTDDARRALRPFQTNQNSVKEFKLFFYRLGIHYHEIYGSEFRGLCLQDILEYTSQNHVHIDLLSNGTKIQDHEYWILTDPEHVSISFHDSAPTSQPKPYHFLYNFVLLLNQFNTQNQLPLIDQATLASGFTLVKAHFPMHKLLDARIKRDIILPIAQFKDHSRSPKATLFWGSEGSGKYFLAKLLADHFGFLILDSISDLSSFDIQAYYKKAMIHAFRPTCIIIRRLDLILETAPLSRILSLFSVPPYCPRAPFIFVTSRTKSFHPSLDRPGRLDQKYFIGLPTESERTQYIASNLGSHVTNISNVCKSVGPLHLSDLRHLIYKIESDPTYQPKNRPIDPSFAKRMFQELEIAFPARNLANIYRNSESYAQYEEDIVHNLQAEIKNWKHDDIQFDEDLFGNGFLVYCLTEFKWQSDRVLEAVKKADLPPHLRGFDELTRMFKEWVKEFESDMLLDCTGRLLVSLKQNSVDIESINRRATSVVLTYKVPHIELAINELMFFCNELKLDHVSVIGQANLLHLSDLSEISIIRHLQTVFEECAEYNKSMCILHLDVLVGLQIKLDPPKTKTIIQYKNVLSYVNQLFLQYGGISSSVNPKQFWLAVCVSDPFLLYAFQTTDPAWPPNNHDFHVEEKLRQQKQIEDHKDNLDRLADDVRMDEKS